jgi:hypothetical protein
MPAAGAVECPAGMGDGSVRAVRMGYFIVTVTAFRTIRHILIFLIQP